MQRRADEAGLDLRIDSNGDGGTSVTLELPRTYADDVPTDQAAVPVSNKTSAAN